MLLRVRLASLFLVMGRRMLGFVVFRGFRGGARRIKADNGCKVSLVDFFFFDSLYCSTVYIEEVESNSDCRITSDIP